MKGCQCNVRVSVFGLQLDGKLQRLLDFGAQSLSKRLGHTDALTVAAQCVGLPIVGVGVFWVGFLQGLGALCGVHEHVKLGLFFGFQVVGINAGSLVGNRDSITTGFDACVKSLLKFAVMK